MPAMTDFFKYLQSDRVGLKSDLKKLVFARIYGPFLNQNCRLIWSLPWSILLQYYVIGPPNKYAYGMQHTQVNALTFYSRFIFLLLIFKLLDPRNIELISLNRPKIVYHLIPEISIFSSPYLTTQFVNFSCKNGHLQVILRSFRVNRSFEVKGHPGSRGHLGLKVNWSQIFSLEWLNRIVHVRISVLMKFPKIDSN